MQGLIIVAIPLLAQFLFVGLLVVELDKSEKLIQREEQAKEVLSVVDRLMAHTFEAGVALYTYNYTFSQLSEQTFDQRMLDIDNDLKQLKRLTVAPRTEDPQFNALRKDIRLATDELKRRRQLLSEDRMIALQDQAHNLLITEKFMGSVKALGKLEHERYPHSAKALANRKAIRFYIYIGLMINSFVAVLVALFFIRNIEFRIKRILENISLFAANQKLLPPSVMKDEISQVDVSFHGLAQSLRQAERAKQEFIAMVSHDIRTPLTSLKSMLDLMKDEPPERLDPELRELVDDAAGESRRLIALTNNLIDSAQIEKHTFAVSRQKMDIAHAVDQAIASVRAISQTKKVQVKSFCPQIMVNADYDRVLQVLVNIISNAIKYSPVESFVEVGASEESNGMVLVEIIDRGNGVPDGEKEEIFIAFHRRDGSKAFDPEGFEGLGLGLAICKSIIDLHGGEIGVEDGDQGGSVFWFTLPAD